GQGTLGIAGPRDDVEFTQTLVLEATEFGANLAGMWMWEGVEATETDLEDTLDALYDQLNASQGSGISYSQTYGVATGIAAADLVDPPEPPVLTPGGSSTPPALPPLVVPDNAPDPVIRRVSQEYGEPTLTAEGFPVDWEPTSNEGEPYARLQIVVEGEDITWINGAPTPMPSWSRTAPFGDYSG